MEVLLDSSLSLDYGLPIKHEGGNNYSRYDRPFGFYGMVGPKRVSLPSLCFMYYCNDNRDQKKLDEVYEVLKSHQDEILIHRGVYDIMDNKNLQKLVIARVDTSECEVGKWARPTVEFCAHPGTDVYRYLLDNKLGKPYNRPHRGSGYSPFDGAPCSVEGCTKLVYNEDSDSDIPGEMENPKCVAHQ